MRRYFVCWISWSPTHGGSWRVTMGWCAGRFYGEYHWGLAASFYSRQNDRFTKLVFLQLFVATCKPVEGWDMCAKFRGYCNSSQSFAVSLIISSNFHFSSANLQLSPNQSSTHLTSHRFPTLRRTVSDHKEEWFYGSPSTWRLSVVTSLGNLALCIEVTKGCKGVKHGMWWMLWDMKKTRENG